MSQLNSPTAQQLSPTMVVVGVVAQGEMATKTEITITEEEMAVSNIITETKSPQTKGRYFWAVIFSLCLIGFTAPLDGTIIVIALPHITNDLSLGDKYIHVGNCFVFAQTVVQPAIAQLCDIFGRRWPLIISVIIFAIGSGIAGGANNSDILILGRTLQGLGSGGIMLLIELIICDLVPMRERGKYFGIVLSTSALGTIVGPALGGVLGTANWRWCFYLNLPICGVVIFILVFFLRIKHISTHTWSSIFTQIDWTGNFIFIGSTTALLIGLTFGGTVFEWSSWRIVLPIIIGCLGWILFHVYEYKIRDTNPCIPPRVFSNRTSLAAYYMIFVTSLLIQWVCFYWPVYFMAVRGASLTQTSVNFLPYVLLLIPGSAVVGVILSKTGYYRPLHLVGFILGTLGPGLNVLLDQNTHAGIWATIQIIDALGRACIIPTTLPAVLASLSESDVASATGVYSFLRSFGYVWGITIPGIIFKNRFDQLSYTITDPAVREALSNGRAYGLSTGDFIQTLSPETKSQVLQVYLEALKLVWYGAVAFGASGLIAVAIEKHVPLRTELETQYGLDDDEKSNDSDQQRQAAAAC